MTTPSEVYGRTIRGRQLAAIINDPVRYVEFRAFSREEFPAITALVSLVKPELDTLRHSDRREFDAAKQYVGWAVGVVMRAHGHNIVGRSRVPGGLFTVGAIWSGEPIVNPEMSQAADPGASQRPGTPSYATPDPPRGAPPPPPYHPPPSLHPPPPPATCTVPPPR